MATGDFYQCRPLRDFLDWNAESERHTEWLRDSWARAEPHLQGSAYVNHIATDDAPEKVRASFGAGLDRLRLLKARYDPANLFRLNPNIAPMARPARSTRPAR